MDKQTKNPSLFKQALEIAIKEGKAQSSKDADTFNSGIFGENYLLFTRQKKLLISIPLENLKRNMKRDTGEGCIMSFGCLSFIAIAIAIVIPSFINIKGNHPSDAAGNIVATYAKECAVKKAQGELDPKFTKIKGLNYYTFTPVDTDCDGDENNLITAQSKNTEKFPTYSYNVKTGEKTCSHNGPNEELYGCSARSNGEWQLPSRNLGG